MAIVSQGSSLLLLRILSSTFLHVLSRLSGAPSRVRSFNFLFLQLVHPLCSHCCSFRSCIEIKRARHLTVAPPIIVATVNGVQLLLRGWAWDRCRRGCFTRAWGGQTTNVAVTVTRREVAGPFPAPAASKARYLLCKQCLRKARVGNRDEDRSSQEPLVMDHTKVPSGGRKQKAAKFTTSAEEAVDRQRVRLEVSQSDRA